MKKTTFLKRNHWITRPSFGILLYFVLYFIATLLYPGGSQADAHSKGFSWIHNYWCNLLNENAINGEQNGARPIALTAMFILCFSLIIFWYIFPKQIELKKTGRLTIQIPGIAAMLIGMFLSSKLHDMVINVATLVGLIAVTRTFVALYVLKWTRLVWMGVFNIALVVLNNIFYYGEGLMYYLPVIQKITFLYFLVWICLIDINLYNRTKAIVTKAG